MKKNPILAVVFFIMLNFNAFSQNVGINSDNTQPHASAMLHVKSANKGLLIPQIALAGVDDAATIPTPATGLLVYNTAIGSGLTAGYCYNAGTTVAPVWTRFVFYEHYIGEIYGGGIIFWLDESKQCGLIAATSDQSAGIRWDSFYANTGATLNGIYAGKANTAKIVSNQGAGNYAAKLCDDYAVTLNNEYYNDWYLPSKDELNLLRIQKGIVGGFTGNPYWSSSEIDPGSAWFQNFSDGFQYGGYKSYSFCVRAVRAF